MGWCGLTLTPVPSPQGDDKISPRGEGDPLTGIELDVSLPYFRGRGQGWGSTATSGGNYSTVAGTGFTPVSAI